MFQTLTEALEANSLEHKLEMQIKASLEEGEMNEKLKLANKLPLTRKLSMCMFKATPDAEDVPSVNKFFKKYFNCRIYLSMKDLLFCTVVDKKFYDKYFIHRNKIDSIGWRYEPSYQYTTEIDLYKVPDNGPLYGVCNFLGYSDEILIFSNVTELDLTRLR